MAIRLVKFRPDLPGFEALLAKSLDEGHRMVLKLSENWASGANRFKRRGELINAAVEGDRMVGVGGRMIDPHAGDKRIARVEHVYVHPDYRRHGVGRMLMEPVIADPKALFDLINCTAPPEAYAFYEALGFVPVLGDATVTHRLNLHLARAGME